MAKGIQTDIVSRQYNQSERCGVSGKSVEKKPRYRCEYSLFNKYSSHYYRLIAKKGKKALLVSSALTGLGVECQENSWNTELDTALRVSRSPALHYWPIATKMTLFVCNARRVLVVEYYENPTTVRLQYSIRKLLFLIDHLHSN